MHIDVLLVQRGKPEIPLEKILHRIFSICPCSSVGQSDGLISHRSVVRSHPLAPTADAVFISFHVRSWGLRPKKYSPFEYSTGGAMAAHLAHNQETGFESHGCNHCGVEQLVARQPHKLKVAGSNPASRTQGIALPFFCDVFRRTQQFQLKQHLSVIQEEKMRLGSIFGQRFKIILS